MGEYMINKLLLYIIGVFLVSLSICFMIIYLNLFTIGYTTLEYLKYIFSKGEIFLLILGIILIVVGVYKRREIL